MISPLLSALSTNQRRHINWQTDLKNPQQPGDYKVSSLGIVKVTQQDIEDANRYGRDIKAELVDISTDNDRMPIYRLGRFFPA